MPHQLKYDGFTASVCANGLPSGRFAMLYFDVVCIEDATGTASIQTAEILELLLDY